VVSDAEKVDTPNTGKIGVEGWNADLRLSRDQLKTAGQFLS
jgi:hypothetical protein